MKQGKKKVITKKTNKLEDHHVDFVLKKLAEGAYSNQEIANLFNDVYGDEVTITRQNVVYYAHSGKFDDQIYDLRLQLSQDVTKTCKFANLNVQLEVISDQVEKARSKNDSKLVFEGIKLISQLTGKLVSKTESSISSDLQSSDREEVRKLLAEIEREAIAEYM